MAEEAPAAAAPAKARGSSAGTNLSKQILEILANFVQRGGTSAYAIKKSLKEEGVDVKKLNSRINQTLMRLVGTGDIVHVSGTGASGSFKLAKTESSGKRFKATLAKSAARKSVGEKVGVKKAGTPKEDKKQIKKPAAKKSAEKTEQKRRAKPKTSGKVAPKKQKISPQKKVTQRKSATSKRTSVKGKK